MGELTVAGPVIDLMPHPITTEGRTWIEVTGGQTLEEAIAPVIGPLTPAEAVVNGVRFSRSYWGELSLKPSDVVQVRAIVHGGNDGSNVIAIVLTIVVLIYAPHLAASLATSWGVTSTVGISAITALVQVGGVLIVNSLFPPRLPALSSASASVPRQYSIAGGSNLIRRYQPVMLVLGRHRVFPDLAGKPYSSFDLMNDQYLNQMFDFGIGGNDLHITDLKIGDTLLTDFDDVQTSYNPADNLVYGNVDTIQGGDLSHLVDTYESIQRTTAKGTTRIVFDLAAIHYVIKDSKLKGKDTSVFIRGSEKLSSGFRNEFYEKVTLPADDNEARTTIRRSFEFVVPAGEYTVSALSGLVYDMDTDLSKTTLRIQIVQFRAYQDDTSNYTGRTPFAVKIRATGQLYGRIERLNALVGHRVSVLQSSGWSTAVSENPGFIALQWCRGFWSDGSLLAGMGLDDSMIDIDSFVRFALFCESNDFTFNVVLLDNRNRLEILSLILKAGWGSLDRQSGKMGVLWDKSGLAMSSLVTPDSVIAGTLSIKYDHEGLSDEIIGSFADANNDYQSTPIRRLLPGITTPRNPANIELEGITNGIQAAKAVNQMVAANHYHRRSIVWEMEVEESRYLARGDVVGISHGLLGDGHGGRLTGITSASPGINVRSYVMVNNRPDDSEKTGRIWIWDMNGDVHSTIYNSIYRRDTGEFYAVLLSSGLPPPPPNITDDPLAYRYMIFPSEAELVKVRIMSKEPAGEGRFRFLARDEIIDYYNFRIADLTWKPVKVQGAGIQKWVGQFFVTESDSGARIFDWQEHPSPDIVGYKIRYGAVNTEFPELGVVVFKDMLPMHEGYLTTTYYESVGRPPAGDWRFGMIAVFGGAQVSNVAYTQVITLT